MGIVNVTPDSFFDGGTHFQHDLAIKHALALIDEGADIIDIGGESTRPGALSVSVQQELDRVIPVIDGLRDVPVVLSIDSCKSEVIQAAIAAGAHMINDINALQDQNILSVAAENNVAVCLMHKQGQPHTMQVQPNYHNVVVEVREFLRCRIEDAVLAGIDRQRLVIDVGFGFGKSLAHNLALLRDLNEFTMLGLPVLAGLSRKSMLGMLTGQVVTERLAASVASALIAVQQGASIVRVHDVRATVDALKVLNAVQGRN